MFKRKLIVLIVLFVGVIGLSGCDTQSSQRIAYFNSAISQAQQVSASYDVQADSIIAAMPGLEAVIADSNLPPAMQQKAKDTLSQLKTKLISIQAEKLKVDAAISNYQMAIKNIDVNSPDFNTELQIYGTGLQQIAPVAGPYAGWVYLAGLGLTTIGGFGAAMKKASDEKKKQKQLDQVVTANDVFMKENPEAATALKATQKILQTVDTVAAVKKIQSL